MAFGQIVNHFPNIKIYLVQRAYDCNVLVIFFHNPLFYLRAAWRKSLKKILLVSRCAWTLYNFRASLMRAIRMDGDVVICGGAGGDGFENKIENMGVPFVPLPLNQRGRNPLGEIRLFWTLYRWYRREKPEVVHHFTIKPVIYGSIAARLARVPRIINTITGLGSAFGEDQMSWLRHLVKWLYRLALTCSHFNFFHFH